MGLYCQNRRAPLSVHFLFFAWDSSRFPSGHTHDSASWTGKNERAVDHARNAEVGRGAKKKKMIVFELKSFYWDPMFNLVINAKTLTLNIRSLGTWTF
jgi:hypothetical protein